jgi:chromosome segregation ATPase
MNYAFWVILIAAISLQLSCQEEATDTETTYNAFDVRVDSLSDRLTSIYEAYGALQARHDNLMNEVRALPAVDSVALSELQRAGGTLSRQDNLLASIEERIDRFDEFDVATATPEAIEESNNALDAEYTDMDAQLTAVQDALATVRTILDSVREDLIPIQTDE